MRLKRAVSSQGSVVIPEECNKQLMRAAKLFSAELRKLSLIVIM